MLASVSTCAAEPATLEEKQDLKSLNRQELESLAVAMREPSYRGQQLFEWIYGKGATRFEEMTNLPKEFRERLADTKRISSAIVENQQVSSDGTVKALMRLESGRHVEAVLIPEMEGDRVLRATACVSSQVGCPMACAFCATGTMGFHENLSAGQIFDQARAMDQIAGERLGRGLSNIVFMGMGEPLLNYASVVRSVRLISDPAGLGLSQRRITISTVGLARRIKHLADEDIHTRLAVSLHAPTDEKRSAIMPVNRAARTDLSALKEALVYYYRQTSEPITFEYCLFDGVNDTDQDASDLALASKWIPSKVNLIMYNPVAGLPFSRTRDERMNRFVRRLVKEGVTVTVRRSRGQDIDAACGQLAVSETHEDQA
ncbi:MAG: 23S rRNA (adenine(2503)-C(2))-methyltransferase RlmN [Rhodothermia bacterium]|nr:23S rRNA (adenine(2503)-C(2))-methyltransferase RlmN [Rhodothermia bacterium]